MTLIFLLGIIIWGYLLSVFSRANLTAYHYIWGTIGIFFILINLSDPFWVWELTQFITTIVGFISHFLHLGQSFSQYGGIWINNANSPVFLTIDYECSGIIEIVALLSLLLFFPVYSRKEKLVYALLGSISITIANVIRLMTVIIIVNTYGSQSFFWAHSIIGRIIFYVITIIIYYYTFTYTQINSEGYKQVLERLRKSKK